MVLEQTSQMQIQVATKSRNAEKAEIFPGAPGR
jgi:hypothetical protein